ncbi:MAG: hypothetical protein WDO73_00230 [Ignavibacteriota bacterium]
MRTDDRMETNLRGVYAAGDCAEVGHIVTGRPDLSAARYNGQQDRPHRGGPISQGRASASRASWGTSIVKVFEWGFATTGLTAGQARAEGFSPVAVQVEAKSRPGYFGGTKTHVELVADRATRRLLGGSVIWRRWRRRTHQCSRYGAPCGQCASSNSSSSIWPTRRPMRRSGIPLLVAAQQFVYKAI